MDVWIRVGVIIIGSVLGSGGLWAYIQSRDTSRNASTRLLMGIAYSKITELGDIYTKRGSITRDEYEDYRKYYYDPYKALGGNGAAEWFMRRVSDLPIKNTEVFRIQDREGEFINNVRLVARPSESASERS